MSLNFKRVVAELVRALRGRRSQLALSRRLRFQTNVVYTWERQRRHPSATQVLELAERVGADLPAAFRGLYPVKPPPWMADTPSFKSREVVAQFLSDARGATPVVHLAEVTGFSRFALARWLSGAAEPRAWEFLALIHHCTHRLVDFLEPFTQSKPLGSLQSEYERVHAARQVAERFPLSQVLLRCLELQSSGQHGVSQSFAERIGISKAMEREMLSLLEATGQIRAVDGRWELLRVSPLNMRLHRETAHLHRGFWASVARDRAPTASDGLCAYNVCGVSRESYEQLKRLQREYLQKARALIEKSEPVQRVALLQVNLVALVDDEGVLET
jgi:hypothetical protein